MSVLDELDRLATRITARMEALQGERVVAEWEALRAAATRLGIPIPAPTGSAEPLELPSPEQDPAAVKATTERRPRRSAVAKRTPQKPARRRVPADEQPGDDVRFADVAALRGWRRSDVRRPKTRRADDVLRIVRESPGITVREVATKLGIDPTGLYRVVGELQSQGLLRKEGTTLHPAGDDGGGA